MPRNRKKQDSPLSVGLWIRAALLCLVLGGTAMGYVWQKSQIHQLGTEVRKKEMRLDLLRGDNERWQQLRAEMRSTKKLYDRVRALGLGLAMPQPEQVLRLPDLPLDAKELKQSKPGDYRTVTNKPRWEQP
ncbi:MAG: hypothetical protein QF721_08730 [Verrucomicrobiota bacterium]|jgi:hypothetical protein|nr:hypothetical protein [Verrucomicrobiota bacterium]